MKNDRLIKKTAMTGGIILLVGVTALVLAIFQRQMQQLLFNMTIQNISEIRELYADSVRNKFNDYFEMLEIHSHSFSDVNMNDTEAIKARAKTIKKTAGFKSIAIVNKDGIAIDLSGKALPNMRNKSYFQETIAKQEQQVSNGIELDVSLEPTLTLTYPFKDARGNPAMTAGIFSYGILKQLLSVSVFSGQSYSYLIAEDGNIILCNKDRNKVIYNVNFYDYINKSAEMENPDLQKLKLDIVNERSGYITVDGVENKKLFSYTPLGINGWYIISVLPYSYIKNQQLRITVLVYLLLFGIAFAVAVFILTTYLLTKRTAAIEKDNERLTIATNQAQTLIFEYDATKKSVEFSGDTQFILGTTKKTFELEVVNKQCRTRVHPEDTSVLTNLKESMKDGKSNFSAEFRYKSFDGTYFWVKMTGSPIFYEDGTLKSYIGSITNVNSQVLHEQELRNIADRDRLSYLLNKNAMERKVREYLCGEGKDRLSALFIVDLDNFKNVNDILGHMTGDLAIKDAAKKISLVFSDKDYLSRFGGDEFLILMRFDSDIEQEKAMHILNAKAADLSKMLREDYHSNDQTVSVSASIGIAIAPLNGTSYDELFKHADKALYEVKRNGKDGYRLSD